MIKNPELNKKLTNYIDMKQREFEKRKEGGAGAWDAYNRGDIPTAC